MSSSRSKKKDSAKISPTPEFNPDLLPRRLYATDRYPPDGRINSYSNPSYLLDLVECLEGTDEFNYLRASCFGGLFDLPVRKSSMSGKLVHQMLCRSLKTEKKYEIWFLFGSKPFRFSLREFGILTGLPCGPYPKIAELKELNAVAESENSYWNKLISSTKKVMSIKDIVGWLKVDRRKPIGQRMPGWRRLRLALIVIVEGILICSSQPVRVSKQVVEMVKDLKKFEEYPWGRDSFQLTLRMVTVSNKCPTLDDLIFKLNQSHTATHGFTLAFQLMIFKAIPAFERFLPDSDDEKTFTDRSIIHLTQLKTFHNSNIMETENRREINIDGILSSDEILYDYVNVWSDEVDDPSVVYMERLIDSGFKFTKEMWQGGESVWPVIVADSKSSKNLKKCIQTSKQTNVSKIPANADSSKERQRKGKNPVVEESQKPSSWDCLGEAPMTNIKEYIDEKLALHSSVISKMWSVERSLMKDELFDEIISEIRHGGKFPRTRHSPGKQHEMVDRANDLVDKTQFMVDKTSAIMNKASGFARAVWPGYEVVSKIAKSVSLTNLDPDIGHSAPKPVSEEVTGVKLVSGGVGNVSLGLTESDQQVGGTEVTDSINFENELPVPMSGVKKPSIFSTTPKSGTDGHNSDNALNPDPSNKDGVFQPNLGVTELSDGTDDVSGEVSDEMSSQDASNGQDGETEGQDDEVDGQADESDGQDSNIDEQEDNTNEDEDQTDGEDELDVGDVPAHGVKRPIQTEESSDALPSKRLRKAPRRFQDSKPRKKPGRPTGWRAMFAKLNPTLQKKFLSKLSSYRGKEYIIDGRAVHKSFFTAIHTPEKALETLQVEAILSLVWRQIGEKCLQNRVGILDPWFTHLLVADFNRFKKLKRKNNLPWNSMLKNYVRGIIPGRQNKLAWYVDTDTVYAPMNWGKDHWVMLAIDLTGAEIHILDPYICANADKKMLKTMTPIVEMLPLLIRDVMSSELPETTIPGSFRVSRLVEVSQDDRVGDLGVLAVKFAELHSQGYPVDQISETMVDNVRMKYAFDLYEEFIQSLSD